MSLSAAGDHRGWQGLQTFAFGDSPAMADALAELVLGGVKRATCWAARHGTLVEVGQRTVMLDGSGRPRAILETIDLVQRRLAEIDAAFADAEGEGDRTLASWQAAHRAYFARQGQVAEDMILYCERFRLVEVIALPA